MILMGAAGQAKIGKMRQKSAKSQPAALHDVP
jgi:hypothetical protein